MSSEGHIFTHLAGYVFQDDSDAGSLSMRAVDAAGDEVHALLRRGCLSAAV